MQIAQGAPGETRNHGIATRSLFAWFIASALVLGLMLGWVARAEPVASANTAGADATATRSAELAELNQLRTQVAEQATACATAQPSPTPTQGPAGEMGQEHQYGDIWTVVVVDAVPVPGTDTVKPKGMFMEVHLILTHHEPINKAFPFHELVLVDSQDRPYTVAANESRELIAPGWDAYTEPSQPTARTILFDVAPDAGTSFVLESTMNPAFRVKVEIVQRG
jgi:hypothetical protein